MKMNQEMRKILDRTRFAQVGFVVNDIEKTKKDFALLFGCEAPATVSGGEYSVTKTTIFGKEAPLAECKLAFFDLVPGVQLELIEPNGEHSVWRDELDRCGEGVHHIAFQVDDSDSVIRLLEEKFEGTVEQQGNYGDGTGRYTYMSLHGRLKCRIELLESF